MRESIRQVEEKREQEERALKDNKCKCRDYRCKTCNPPPAFDEALGPAVFDPYLQRWTYPYTIKEEPEVVPEPVILTNSVRTQTTTKQEMYTQTGDGSRFSPEEAAIKL
jgi:hypothetical protein